MSIDARVAGITRMPDGCYRLYLEDRDKRSSRGQPFLWVKADERINQLVGECIWGGASEIMLRDVKLATRHSITELRLVDNWPDVINSNTQRAQPKEPGNE